MTFEDVYEFLDTVWGINDKERYAIDIHTIICGNTVEALNECIYAIWGYRNVEQLMDIVMNGEE